MTITGRKAPLLVGVLILSLSLNVFGAAVWASHKFRDRSGPYGFGIGRLVRSAPEPAQEIIRQRFDDARPQIAAGFEGMREARGAIATAMHDPATSPEALAQAFAEMRRRADAVELLVHETLLDALATMPPDLRTRWAGEWAERR